MMEKTRSKSKAYFTTINVMAAMFSLLLFGLFYTDAKAASAAPDIQVNGMDNTVTLASENTLTVTVQLNAGEQTGEQADWWIIAATPMGWYYYEYPDKWYLSGVSMEDVGFAYQGALFNLTEPLEVLRVSGLPVGNYAFYFGVDMNMNGTLTGGDALYYDGIEVNIFTSGGSFPVVDTNQGLCYDNSELIDCPAEGEAFYGQDAQYTGNVPSYTDNGDGTVTDNVTGLVWTQDQSDRSMDWSEAPSYCESLTTGGITDLRLPNIKELWSIRDLSEGWPWVDTNYFYLVSEDGFEGAQQHSWSSNYYLVDTEEAVKNVAFVVNDWTGHIKALDGRRYVRCVSGDTYGINDFVDNSNGTITDNATGLMWAKNDSGEAMNWEAALAYAEKSTYAGYDDWRLPNVKELQSIADYSGVFPAIDSTMFNVSGITNEAGNADYPYYWTGTSNPYIDPRQDDGSGYCFAWYVAFGYAVDEAGNDMHGAGAVRFDAKSEDAGDGPDGERYYNYVRLVRDAKNE